MPNNDGIGQVGAGASDDRIAGSDLQHYRQHISERPLPGPERQMTQSAELGGPMKQYMDEHAGRGSPMKEVLAHESKRHDESMKHQKSHIQKHVERPYDSQHGHDGYKYEA